MDDPMPVPNARSFKNAAYAHLAEVGKALSSATRLEILELLAQAPRTVEVLAAEVEQSVANTSHHLQVLKRARLVTGERDGLHVVYSVAGEDVGALLNTMQAVALRHLDALDELTRDYFAKRDALEAIDPHTLLVRLRADDAVLIDVRPEHEFAAGHIPGALSVPLSALEAHLESLPKDRTIIAYCRGPFCALSAEAARRLRELGFDARRTDATVSSVELVRGSA
jgi:rhodanese-related sulfurtransferase/DNA-binding transcriptional ArsR family regulator